MVVSKTPLRNVNQEQEPEALFGAPTAQQFEPDPSEREEEEDPRFAAMEKRMADLQSALEESQRTSMALLTQPPKFENNQQLQPQKFDLPDPALDPEGYREGVRKQVAADIEFDRARNNTQQTRQKDLEDKVNGLWEDFNEAYPDMDQEKVEFAATSVIKKAKRRGLDAERYMFVTQDKFIGDVAKEYVRIFGEEEPSEDNDPVPAKRGRPANDPAPRRNASRRNGPTNDDVGRTGGVFGGQESGGRPGKLETDEGPNMLDDMQAFQKRTGFF